MSLAMVITVLVNIFVYMMKNKWLFSVMFTWPFKFMILSLKTIQADVTR